MIGQFELLLPGRLIRELILMIEIDRDSSISQNRMADKVGLVPSMVNTYIRRMIDQGYLSKQGATRRRTTYHLTESGRARCAMLMRCWGIETVRLYKYAKQEFRRRLAAKFDARRDLKIVLYGAAETGELVYQLCCEMGHRVVGVVDSDPSKQGAWLQGSRITDPSRIESSGPDVVLITSMGHAGEIYDVLAPLRGQGIEVYTIA